jgi:hypothetical protein
MFIVGRIFFGVARSIVEVGIYFADVKSINRIVKILNQNTKSINHDAHFILEDRKIYFFDLKA